MSRDLAGRRWLIAAVALGAVLRLVIRLASGEDAFLTNGYTFYLDIARTAWAGDGLCYAPGESCALRMPLYPLLLAPLVAAGAVYPVMVIAQALMGGLLAWIAWWIGRELFSERVGMIGAFATALNPYAVLHDTALQDTALFNLLFAASIALLLRAARGHTAWPWLLAGVSLSLAILTSARIALLVPVAIAWVIVAAPGAWTTRARMALLVALPIVVMSGGWMARNWRLVGAPVLTTEGGEGLYFGNSPLTFLHFPERSIDLTAGEIERLPAPARHALARLSGDDLAVDRLYRGWAIDYILANPLGTARGALSKVWVVVAAQLSPGREPLYQWGYRAWFLPLHLLAVVGAWRARGRGHLLIAGCLLAFALTTAVFWAHTSHKSYLDALIFIYAGAGACALAARRGAVAAQPVAQGEDWPRISIVIPSLNQGAYLEQAIRSVLDQGYPRVEVIVVDGGSSDGSRELIARYAARLAWWTSEPDAGPAEALRKGFARATGDVLGFLNADDFLLPNSLAAIGGAFAADGAADVISGHGRYALPSGALGPRAFSDRWDAKRFACGACVLLQPATFFRRQAFDRAGGLRVSGRVCWDMELWADLARTGAVFNQIDNFLAAFRIHPLSISGSAELGGRRRRDARAVMAETRGRPETAADRASQLVHRFRKFIRHPLRSFRQRLFFRNTLGRWTL